MSGVGSERHFMGQALDIFEAASQNLVGPVLDDPGCLSVSGATRGRVVFEPAILRWIVGGSDHHTISKPLLLSAVVGEDGVGDHRGGRVAETLLNHDCYPSRGKHLKAAG